MSRFVLLIALVVINVFIFSFPVPNGLSVSFLDVGQGDAIFIESPTGVQMLIDGGATRDVLREMGSRMPFFDRTLDMMIATHPDQDHIGGLVDVLGRYRTLHFMESGIVGDTSASRALGAALIEHDVPRVVARRGMRILLGGGAYADVLFPDRDVSNVETNTGSIIMRVVYGEHEFLLTGDSPKSIETYLALGYGSTLESDVLKAGHHGSKTSSDPGFVSAVAPTYAVVSAGKDNRYGHPHQEVLEIFMKRGMKVLSTAELGTITFRSNGKTLRVSEH